LAHRNALHRCLRYRFGAKISANSLSEWGQLTDADLKSPEESMRKF
jgi:hypothetical protein